MRYVVFCFLMMLSSFSVAQVKVSGRITDKKQKGIAGVSVQLKNTYDGATTDTSGYYTFQTDEKGDQLIEATASGYFTISQPLTITADSIVQDFILKEQVTELKAVVISAGSFEASDKSKGAVLSSLDIVTTPSANGDVTSAFKSLPGTQQVGESEGLFVRGGSATESKIYMDGNLVNNFFFSSTPGIATRGRFNPFLFKGTVFSTGGYSALYGQALSSVLLLESTDLPQQTEADLSITAVGIGGGIQHLSKDKKSSWGLTFNHTNLWLAFNVIKQKQDFFQVPVVNQGDFNFRIKTKKGGFVKYYGYISHNVTGFRTNDIDSIVLKTAFEIKNLNIYQNLNWKDRLSNGWKIATGVSFSTNKDDIVNELQDAFNKKVVITEPGYYAAKNFDLVNKGLFAQGRVVLEKKLIGLNAVRFGADYFYSDEKTTFTTFSNNTFSTRVVEKLFAGFAETDVYLTNNLAAKIGARAEHSAVLNQWNFAPRVSLAYKLAENTQASLAFGTFYQNPERRYLPSVASLDFSKSTHYIFQLSKQTKDYTFRTEVFYKKYNRLYKTGRNNNNQDVIINTMGYGDAKGLEFFWRDKKTLKNVDYWISYSYLDTKRDYLNFPAAIQPSFAANHTAALVFKRFVLPWKTGFNVSYNFATGRPFYNISYDNGAGKYTITDQGKTINYNSLGFSINYLPNLGKKDKKTFAVWVLGVSNVLNQNQVFNYNYNFTGTRKEAVTPPSRQFVFVGCFLSFGIDRTQDAINNNL